MRGYILVSYSLFALLVGCGGGGNKKQVEAPSDDDTQVEATPDAKPETEADRVQARMKLAQEIIPEGSSCLPQSLKEEGAPRLQLAAVGKDAVVCAMDENSDRLLGPVGCWTVDLTNGKLTYKKPAPLPGRGFSVHLDGKCARGFCLPGEPAGDVAHIAWNLDGTKVAVLVGDEVHLFDAASKAHESSFSIRGDKGLSNDPKAVHFVDGTILVEGASQGPYSAVWVFKTDGTQVGPITSLGSRPEKPISTYHGSFSILDKTRVALGEKGMATLTTYDVTNGARAKLVRKVPKLKCKRTELDAFWVDGDKVTDRCKESINKASGYLMGATVVAGAKSFLVLLRGDRLGELAVMDSRYLKEKDAIKMPWCEGNGGAAAGEAKDEPAKKKATTRGAVPADSSDPQEGGE